MNLPQFEQIKSDLKHSFYEKNKFSGKSIIKQNHKYAFKIQKAHYRSKQRWFTLSKRGKHNSRLRKGTAGSIIKESRGSLTKLPW